VYAQPEHSTNSSRLTFVSPSGIKMRSLKEVDKFLKETANAARIPVKGGLVEAEMQDPHSKNNEWVQGTITKVLAKNSGFKVSFKVENADERGIWEETYKVCVSTSCVCFLPCLCVRRREARRKMPHACGPKKGGNLDSNPGNGGKRVYEDRGFCPFVTFFFPSLNFSTCGGGRRLTCTEHFFPIFVNFTSNELYLHLFCPSFAFRKVDLRQRNLRRCLGCCRRWWKRSTR